MARIRRTLLNPRFQLRFVRRRKREVRLWRGHHFILIGAIDALPHVAVLQIPGRDGDNTFALGVSDEYAIADEGVGPRRIPPLKGHAALSRHIARSLVEAEFDISIFQDTPLDHGLHSPLTMMWPSQPDWPGRVVPLVVNVIQQPLPRPSRCFSLGKALGKAIASYPEDLKVAMVGTGGLSHQMIGERAGFNDERWDREFLELIERDPERLARMSIEDFMRLGGNEGAEIIMWLIMRGALAPNARKVHQNYYLPMTTAMAVAVFE
jgi:hypothetical protein